MIHAIQIPHDEERPLYKVAVNDLASLQDAVGGYIQAIDVDEVKATIFLNEEGKLMQLPINRRATLLWWLLFPSARNVDVIVGDAIITGQPDKYGNSTDVPDGLVTLLFDTPSYKAEFQTYDDPLRFNGNQLRFTDYFEAANHALLKAQNWTAVQRTRVVPADDAPRCA